jgi:hypothetical protein
MNSPKQVEYLQWKPWGGGRELLEIDHLDVEGLQVNDRKDSRLWNQAHAFLVVRLPLPSAAIHYCCSPVKACTRDVNMSRGENVRDALYHEEVLLFGANRRHLPVLWR